MIKLLIGILSFLLLISSAIIFTPIQFFTGKWLTNNDYFTVEYSYLNGNLFSGEVLDLYIDQNFIGDYTYKTNFSSSEVKVNFLAIDDRKVSGNISKNLNSLNTNSFSITNLVIEDNLSVDLIEGLNILININELTIEDLNCTYINGTILISSNQLKDKLLGNFSCKEDNTISANLKGANDKNLGTIQYYDSQVRVSILTSVLPDKRLNLILDEVSFTIDL